MERTVFFADLSKQTDTKINTTFRITLQNSQQDKIVSKTKLISEICTNKVYTKIHYVFIQVLIIFSHEHIQDEATEAC